MQWLIPKIVSHDDGEDDLGQVNEDDQPFGLNLGCNQVPILFVFWLEPLEDPTKIIYFLFATRFQH